MGEREPSDEELIRSINGDWPDIEAPFATLYARHKGFVLGVASRFASDGDAAQDVVQETFLALLGRFPGFELRGRMTTFLYPLARNLAVTSARKHAVRGRAVMGKALLDRAVVDGGPSPAPGDDRFAPLREAVGALPEAQREVLLLRIVEGLSVGEVALALGVPTGTVKSRLHKAVGALRDDPRTSGYFGV